MRRKRRQRIGFANCKRSLRNWKRNGSFTRTNVKPNWVDASSGVFDEEQVLVVADCQFLHRNLGIKCRLHELANKRRISVTGASKLLANILYHYCGMGLSVGTMIAGWDEKGPCLYYVDSEGGRLKGTRVFVGFGSPYAYGVLDNGYRDDTSVEEASELGRQAIYHATFRDGASGGVASVYHVRANG